MCFLLIRLDLRVVDTVDWFFAIIYEEDSTCEFLFATSCLLSCTQEKFAQRFIHEHHENIPV